AALVGQDHLGHQLQQCRLALPVTADYADRLAGSHGEVVVPPRPELTRTAATLAAGKQLLERPAGATIPLEADAGIRHRDDRGAHQISFSTARSVRLKMRSPSTRNSTLIAAPIPTVIQSSWSGKNAARYRLKIPARGLNEAQNRRSSG